MNTMSTLHKRRGGDLNPAVSRSSQLPLKDLQTPLPHGSVNSQCAPVPSGQSALADARLATIVKHWDEPSEERSEALYRHVLQDGQDMKRDLSEELIRSIAKECRSVVQGYLREEEWTDVDQLFIDIIKSHWVR